MEMFSYTRGNKEFNALVDEALFFAQSVIEGKEIENKDERVYNHNYKLLKYCTEGTRAQRYFEENGLEAFNFPQVQNDNEFLMNFDAFIAQIVSPTLPMVANYDLINLLAEVRQIGYGQTARFIIRSNEEYRVSQIAEGVNRGNLQHALDDEVTLNPTPYEIAYFCDWYRLASGVVDFGYEAVRAARGFEKFIFAKSLKALTDSVDTLGAAYTATGFSNDNWNGLAQKVAAANDNSGVIAVGTLKSLGSVLPATVGMQYGLGKEFIDKGYLDKYNGVKLICLDQVLVPGTVNTTAQFMIPDDHIFFLPVYGDKPIKVAIEGKEMYVDRPYERTPDKTYRARIQMRLDVKAVFGSKIAALEIV